MTAGAGDVAAAALVCLPGMNQTRLRGLLDEWTSASAAWAAATSGRARGIAPELRRRWREIADVTWTRTEQTLARRHTRVWISSDVDAPIPEAIPDRPPVLLGEGCDPGVLERPRVAIVGTRAATPHGLADARELGAVLGEAGVTVISGLAIGIDAAAHEGALEGSGGVIGVVATGLDIVYPRRHPAALPPPPRRHRRARR
jgi:DNA processing protein